MSKTRPLNHKHAYELADRFAEQALRPPPTTPPRQGKPPVRKIAALQSSRQGRPTVEFVNPDAEEQRRRQPWYVPDGDQLPRAVRNRIRNRNLKERREHQKAGVAEARQLQLKNATIVALKNQHAKSLSLSMYSQPR